MIEKYKQFIPVDVFRPANGDDCTLGGASSKYETLYLVHTGITDEQIIQYCMATGEPADRFFRRGEKEFFIGQDYHYHVFLEPCIKCGKRPMFGSNLAYSSDSRFKEFTLSNYPLTIHDRYETEKR